MVGKRFLDITGASVALLFLSPLLVACAIAIKLNSPGPVFFYQRRMGYRGKPFDMVKFRSMYTDRADPTGAQLTSRDGDDRVTRVGRTLRRTSVDELPQLFNVLRGDMSLVGPRPHPSGAKAGGILYDTLIPDFFIRYKVLPGITGLAQVAGHRGNTETAQHLQDRFEYDMKYADNWSVLGDCLIMARTVWHLIEGKNAF